MTPTPCIVFVNSAYGSGATGPETYVRYLWEAFGNDPQLEFHLVAPSFPHEHPRWHPSGAGSGSLDLYLRLAQTALQVAAELKRGNRRVILHLNNSNMHSALLAYRGTLWGQVNDYENADLWRRAAETIRRAGLRRFFALARRRWLERRFLARQDLTLCNSNYTRELVRSEYHPPHPERVITVHKAVDVQYFERPATLPPDPLQRPVSSRKFIFVGGDIVRKGLDTLLEAVNQLPESMDWHLTVVGCTRAEVAAAFHYLPKLDNPRIDFAGRLQKEVLREALWHSQIFVLPSRAEALGVAILEALAAGLPVVATHVGGIPEIVRDTSAGILVNPADPAALAVALAKIQPWPADQPLAVKKILESFSTTVMLARLRELYLAATGSFPAV
ncbi:MAG TPA: glycosyltransferase family 4 protein [Opitutales bacterium]|nr:glycosyltransferase family 4 protein [Opitutales bacterium]